MTNITFVDYTVTDTGVLTYSFGAREYINPDYLKVYIKPVTGDSGFGIITAYTVNGVSGAASITLTGVWATGLTVGDIVRLRRETPVDQPLVDFQPGTLRSDDLDFSYLHTLHAAQESKELVSVEEAMVKAGTFPDNWAGEGLRLANIADGVDAVDAVTKKQLDDATFASGVLDYEQAVRVESADSYAQLTPNRFIQHAQAVAWGSNDEGWQLPLASSDLYQDPTWARRPLVEFHIPAYSMVNGAFLEISVCGEIFDGDDRVELSVSKQRDVRTSAAWTALHTALSAAKTGPFTFRMRIQPCGKVRTLFSTHVMTGGTVSVDATQGWNQTFVDATPASGAYIQTANGLDMAIGDEFDIADGTSVRTFTAIAVAGVPAVKDEFNLGADNEETLRNLQACIHDSRLRLRCEMEDISGTSWRLNIETMRGGNHMYRNFATNPPSMTTTVDSLARITESDFTVAAEDTVANGSDIDWTLPQDFFLSCRRTNSHASGVGGGGIINSVSVLQFGCTKGWEPRV